jgi:CheY-like chemotaxis protein
VSTSEKSEQRLLVVDDEPTILDALKHLLEYEGYQVQTIDGGRAALALMEQEQFDLVITDYAMPGMRGDELGVKIKERWPQQPIIMISASSEILNASGNAPKEVDYLIGKPFFGQELQEAIAIVLANRRGKASLP